MPARRGGESNPPMGEYCAHERKRFLRSITGRIHQSFAAVISHGRRRVVSSVRVYRDFSATGEKAAEERRISWKRIGKRGHYSSSSPGMDSFVREFMGNVLEAFCSVRPVDDGLNKECSSDSKDQQSGPNVSGGGGGGGGHRFCSLPLSNF